MYLAVKRALIGAFSTQLGRSEGPPGSQRATEQHPRSCTGKNGIATADDVRSALSRDTGSVNDPPGLICWQRTVEEVKGLGAAGWGGSRQLEPAPSHRKEFFRLLSGARACIPGAVRPVHGDTAESLKSRLSTSDFLDDIHILKGGKGPGRVRLNATSYPQPRRVTWSVLADIDRDTGAHGLYAYTQAGKREGLQEL